MYQGKQFLAVVGFQTVLFSIRSKEDGYLLDHIQMPLKDYYILTWDGDYAQYIRDFYPNATDAFHVLTVGTVREPALEEMNSKTCSRHLGFTR